MRDGASIRDWPAGGGYNGGHMTAATAPALDDLKLAIRQRIDAHGDALVAAAQEIGREPELGFKEFRTAARVARWFRDLDLPYQEGLARTGVKAILDTGRPGPTVAVIGELDSLLNWEHPDRDPVTGAVHCCGHNCQIGMLLGAATGLRTMADALSGRVAFIAVPAEEYIELEERLAMRERGEIMALSGKGEMVRIGAFDDVDIAMMIHNSPRDDMGTFMGGGTANGMVAKFVRFLGRTSHAGGQPHAGVNALYMAHVALAGINALRETFRDEDHIRVHPIVTRGGDVVNAIPADVRMELFCRGATLEAIEATHRKVDRALKAGALALGGAVEITTLPGYLPLFNDGTMLEYFAANARALAGEQQVRLSNYHGGGSTDMGDLAHLMPVIHPSVAGARGSAHGADYGIRDWRTSVVEPAKALAMTVADLLYGDASGAQRVLAGFTPRMTRGAYLEYLERLTVMRRYEAADLEGETGS